MTAIFGTMTVHVAVIEWEGDRSPDVLVAKSLADAKFCARQRIIEIFELFHRDYNPDGVRGFVLNEIITESGVAPSKLLDSEWLVELQERATVPWVTLTEHTIEIH